LTSHGTFLDGATDSTYCIQKSENGFCDPKLKSTFLKGENILLEIWPTSFNKLSPNFCRLEKSELARMTKCPPKKIVKKKNVIFLLQTYLF
jgi:hypothetical protein